MHHVQQPRAGGPLHHLEHEASIRAADPDKLRVPALDRIGAKRLEGDRSRLRHPGELVEIVVVRASIQAEIHERLGSHDRRALAQDRRGMDRRHRNRHLEDRRHAPGSRGLRPRGPVLPLEHTRIPEVHMRIDHARQHVQARGVDRFAGVGQRVILVDRDNLPIGHRDAAPPRRIRRHHCPATHDQIGDHLVTSRSVRVPAPRRRCWNGMCPDSAVNPEDLRGTCIGRRRTSYLLTALAGC